MTTVTSTSGLTFELCTDCGNWTRRHVDGCDNPIHPQAKGEE